MYPLIKKHPLKYRSVLNDDLAFHFSKRGGGRGPQGSRRKQDHKTAEELGYSITPQSVSQSKSLELQEKEEEEGTDLMNNADVIWTTWKARTKKKAGKEQVVKHCIDYILYSSPFLPTTTLVSGNRIRSLLGVKALSSVSLFSDSSVPQELFPNKQYPSDHISLIADLLVVENELEGGGKGEGER